MYAMKVNRFLMAAAVAGVLLVGCKGHGSSSSSIPASLTNWTWEADTNVANSPGSFSAIGTVSTTNQPSGRSNAMSWKDNQNQFWVFSGGGGFSDMWVFNTANLGWTWEAGTNTSPSNAGVYGTMGTAAASNVPGARSSGATWVDTAGNFWMLGGFGTDSNGQIGYLNDFWTFNPNTKIWTWVGGSNVGGSAATYSFGTMQVASSSNMPNPRSSAMYWTDLSGNFWMFGGQGYLAKTAATQNDLWEYSTSTHQWTWVGGSNTPNAKGIYTGTAQQPGARQQATTWTDKSGNFWMFGGTGIDSAGGNGQLNDLWKFNPSTQTWTFVTGSITVNAIGNYGTNGVAAATNQPGARSSSIGWTDVSGNQWLFGGSGINISGVLANMNDLWEFNVTSNQWIWINGSYNGNATGFYGTLSILSSSNMPGSRYGASGWTDTSTNFWMFGGTGYDAAGSNGQLADMWKFLPT